MGGYGSGRRAETYYYTVEDCRHLDSARLLREGILKANMHWEGSWNWYADENKTEKSASISCKITTESDSGYVRLIYTWDKTEELDYQVRFTSTPVHFGGLRWWFVCPNTRCGKRVGKLYLAPNSKYFLCRTCQNLTYTSCRESHRFDGVYAEIARGLGVSVQAIKKALKEGEVFY